MRIKWIGGRSYKVTDLRHLNGALAFYVESEDGTFQAKVDKGSEDADEIAALIEAQLDH